jgi:hypothetical protein
MPLDDRSAAARLLAEEALVILHDGLGETPLRLIVVGGLVPETLAAADTPAHLGTTDIDILIAVHVRDVADAAPVERALTAIGAIPDPVQPDGWQWRIPVGSVRVRIDFLCDDDSLRNQEAVLLPGCSQLAAFNLRGTGYVARDHWQREITVADRTVQVSFAGLEGYLLAKAHAARQRGQDKDYYDLAYVLLHNHAGGPAQAAERLRAGVFASEIAGLRSLWVELGARFHDSRSVGAEAYARQAVLVDPFASEAALRNDAFAAVAQFVRTLDLE